jgi:glutamyl-tRNA reductase
MIVCLSANYKRAKLPILESLTFKDESVVMKALCSEGLTEECILIQTCHRIEIYCTLKDPSDSGAINRILKFWSVKAGVSLDLLSKIVELYKGREALTHLFNLSAGLESMVLGEDQILGQVRTAYVKAKKLKSARLVLDKAFMTAINTGRRIRNETRVNEGSVSISSAAVDLAEKELGSLRTRTALVIGAGEAGSIAAETLKRREAKSILIANRTYKRGVELASKIAGKAIEFDTLYEAVPKADLIIAAISVERPVLKMEPMRKALIKSKTQRRLFLVDISQPRAIEEKVSLLKDVALRNIDDLKGIVEKNIRNRQIEAEKAKKIILEELNRFEYQQSKLLIQPIVSEIYRRVDDIRRKELGRAVRKMGESDERKLAIIDRFSRELAERILQSPIEQLREAAINNDNGLLASAGKLFKIKPEGS